MTGREQIRRLEERIDELERRIRILEIEKEVRKRIKPWKPKPWIDPYPYEPWPIIRWY